MLVTGPVDNTPEYPDSGMSVMFLKRRENLFRRGFARICRDKPHGLKTERPGLAWPGRSG
jgi:hypothetical protein